MSRTNKTAISIIITILAVSAASISWLYFTRPNAEGVAVAPLKDAFNMTEAVSLFLGRPVASTYLFVLQNSDEMRPTGGFIGTYGLITLEDKHITDFFTDDVYNLDRFVPDSERPPAPEPIQIYLEQPRWYLRDANWSPDFPTSAEQILRFYKEESAYISKNISSTPLALGQIDGVIAIMPEAIRPLLELTGPIIVSGQTFNADNLTDALEYDVEIGFEQRGVARPQRKVIVSELGYALIAKIKDLPASQWLDVLRIAREALEQKQVLLYSVDPRIQAFIQEQGWGGSVRQAPLDYLAVFDANMFSMKTDPYVSKDIFYQVRKKGVALIGETEIVYSYPKSGPAWKTKGYRTWTRVYVPKGSILQKVSGAMAQEGSAEPGRVAIEQEFDKTVFGAFIAVQAGETKRLRFTYRLPDYVIEAVTNGKYELMVQKQPGTLGHSLTVVADFGKVAQQWNPAGLNTKREGAKLIWQTSLKKDQEFRMEFY